MNQPTPSQTPETDAVYPPEIIDREFKKQGRSYGWGTLHDMRELARTLERQRDEAIQARQQSAKEWADQVANADLRTARAKRERDEACAQRDALLAAANRILPFLPDMEPVGAAKYAESNLAAWEFRQLLKTFVR